MDLFKLVARLVLDRSAYEEGIAEAKEGAQSLSGNLKGIMTATKNAVSALGIASVVKKGVDVLRDGVTEVAELGDKVDKASQKLGISAEAYQEWDAVLQHSGTSIDSMGIGLKTMSNAAAEGSDAFTELGISAQEAASMSREDLFAKTIKALQSVTDENKRAQLAQKLFGRSAMELGPLLNTSAEETDAMRQRVHELGGVMSNDAVKSAAAYQDAMQDMRTAIDGAKRSLFSALLPAITSVINAVTDFAPHIGDLVNTFKDFLPVVGAVTAAFVTYKTAVAIGSVIDAVTKATEGMSVAQALLNAVMNANPIMLVVSALAALVTALGVAWATNEEFRNKVKAAWEAVKTVISSVVSGIKSMFDGIGDALGNLGKLFGNVISGAFNWGKDLIENFTNGIKQFIQGPIDAIKGLAGRIKSFLGFSEPEEGPLSNFHTYAPDMMALFAKGIEDNQDLITDAIGSSFNIAPRIQAQTSAGQEIVVPRGGSASGRPVTVVLQLRDTEIGRVMLPILDAERQRVGVNLATGGAY